MTVLGGLVKQTLFVGESMSLFALIRSPSKAPALISSFCKLPKDLELMYWKCGTEWVLLNYSYKTLQDNLL